MVEAEANVTLGASWYEAKVPEGAVRPVELALCTTTFRKEAYVTRNVRLVRERILCSSDPVARHLTVHVVDNGRTLDAAQICSDHVMLHPNPNAGGAGGFARGMIEALRQYPLATHVLLMDDDVAVSPESIVRTYNLLSIVRDEYAEAFLSGAMLRMDEPNVRHEDVAFIAGNGLCAPVKSPASMTDYEQVVLGELLGPRPQYEQWADQAHEYAAWWYCAIPMATVRREGLPLPLFFRQDDVEYGNRCRPRFMTMSGICIWHLSFAPRYNPATDRYLGVRNGFLVQAMLGFQTGIRGALDRWVRDGLSQFSYDSVELALRGLEDYLEGPEWFMDPSHGEQAYLQANREKEQLEALGAIRDDVLARCGVDVRAISLADIRTDLPWTDEEAGDFFSTLNHQLEERVERVTTGGLLHRRVEERRSMVPVPPSEDDQDIRPEDVAVIDSSDDAFQPAKGRGKKALLAINPYTLKGHLRVRDRERFARLWKRYQHDIARYDAEGEELARRYRDAKPEMTSIPFWERYLGLDRED